MLHLWRNLTQSSGDCILLRIYTRITFKEYRQSQNRETFGTLQTWLIDALQLTNSISKNLRKWPQR